MKTLEDKSYLSRLKTDEDFLAAEIVEARQDPLYPLNSKYLKIRTKEAELEKLTPNSAQNKIIELVREKRKAKERVRVWILKARQEGVSTISEALLYCLGGQQENRNCLIMADEDDKAGNLFSMLKLYQEKLEQDEAHLAPRLKKSNEKALEFEQIHSKIVVATANNVDAARSYTFQYVHLSECAFFSHFLEVMLGLQQSVPDHWDTVIIGETTANGRNEFYQEWKRAKDGKTDWIALFIPWFWMKEYAMPLMGGRFYGVDGIKYGTDYNKEQFLRDEAELQREHSLTNEQINWRRWAIVNKCQGNYSAFQQEYPSTDAEAFAMSGAMYFDQRSLAKQEKWIKKPERIGEIFYQDQKWEFRDLENGRIRLYEEPEKEEKYILTLDASEGLAAGDEAAGIVLNSRTNHTAAVLNGQYSTIELADLAIALGNYFNQALIAPENKGYGNDVCQRIYSKYGNLYRRKRKTTGAVEETEELGFNTNTVTRPAMLSALNDEIVNQSTVLMDWQLWDEMTTFIQPLDVNGKPMSPKAENGAQDGLVMCRAIASAVRQEHPYKPPATEPRVTASNTRVRDMMKERRNAGFKFK